MSSTFAIHAFAQPFGGGADLFGKHPIREICGFTLICGFMLLEQEAGMAVVTADVRHPHEREGSMTQTELQEHIFKTYFWLRAGLCFLAFVFPLLLLGFGWWKDVPLQGSMSAYYFAFAPPTSELRDFPTRVVFVGILFALGFFLILYRGFSKTEYWALNIAGLSAILVALFPMQTPDYCKNCGSNAYSFVHGTAALVLFVCIAFVAWACIDETLVQLPDRSRRWFRTGYYALASAMIVAPVAAIVMTYIFGLYDKKTFFVAWFGIATFSAYWALKSYELRMSGVETMALKGQMPMNKFPAERPSIRQRASRLLD